MTGICEKGHIVHWGNNRGGRKPETCPVPPGEGDILCGEKVYLARYNPNVPGKYERANSPARPGTKLAPCVVCGRKRRVPSGNAKRLNRDIAIKKWGKEGYEKFEAKAGDVVCWSHETWDGGRYLSMVSDA